MPKDSQTPVISETPERLAINRSELAQFVSISVEARCYAVKELSRRAGVAREWFETWTVEVAGSQTTITLGPECRPRIRFPHTSEDTLEKIVRGQIPVARAKWFREAGDFAESELILPFCEDQPGSVSPLYHLTADGDIACRFDLLATILFTLSRLEETLSDNRDEHARFPASASLAVRHVFLERPILDEHGLAFEQVLAHLFPSWKPLPRMLQVKLTHDIDYIGIPFQFRTSVGHTLKRRHPEATIRDLFSKVNAAEPAELTLVRKLAAVSRSRKLHSAFYWKASQPGPHDSGYDPADSRIQRVVQHLREQGFELGVHPGYETFGARPALTAEVNRLRETLRLDFPGGRQHYLRWSPQTWLDWEACGLSYDSSVGFAEHFGFRASTSHPYRPWSFAENRELHLIEVPLILMDCTPVKYMKLNRMEALSRIEKIIQRTARMGGVFTLLWHNSPLLDRDYDGWYEPILDMLSSAKSFHVPTRAEMVW